MHHHTVDSISFIARDSGDPRAFSYIHCPSDSIFQLFAIKTEAAVGLTYMHKNYCSISHFVIKFLLINNADNCVCL